MTVQHVEEAHAVIDADIAELVAQAVEDHSTRAATQCAIGATTPTPDAGWKLCLRINPNGIDETLIWVLVTEPQSSHRSELHRPSRSLSRPARCRTAAMNSSSARNKPPCR